jgi:hypothetical protein
MDIHRLFDVDQVSHELVERAGLDGERRNASRAVAIHRETAQARATGQLELQA